MKVDARDAGVRRPAGESCNGLHAGEFPPAAAAKAGAGGQSLAAAGVHRRGGSDDRLLDQGHANLTAHATAVAWAALGQIIMTPPRRGLRAATIAIIAVFFPAAAALQRPAAVAAGVSARRLHLAVLAGAAAPLTGERFRLFSRFAAGRPPVAPVTLPAPAPATHTAPAVSRQWSNRSVRNTSNSRVAGRQVRPKTPRDGLDGRHVCCGVLGHMRWLPSVFAGVAWKIAFFMCRVADEWGEKKRSRPKGGLRVKGGWRRERCCE